MEKCCACLPPQGPPGLRFANSPGSAIGDGKIPVRLRSSHHGTQRAHSPHSLRVRTGAAPAAAGHHLSRGCERAAIVHVLFQVERRHEGSRSSVRGSGRQARPRAHDRITRSAQPIHHRGRPAAWYAPPPCVPATLFFMLISTTCLSLSLSPPVDLDLEAHLGSTLRPNSWVILEKGNRVDAERLFAIRELQANAGGAACAIM